jgi:ribose transport system substrate-binding protein
MKRSSIGSRTAGLALAAAGALLLTACNSGGGSAEGGADSYRVAFLASSSQNGYNKAVWDGVQQGAKDRGNVDVEIFDGEFDANTQFNQMQDIASSGRYDGIVIVPNDNVGIAAALPAAASADIPVATVLFPIGSDLQKMEPQVDGVVSTVASDPVAGAAAQADRVIEYCQDKDPCKVAILIGQLRFPFDKLRYDTYVKELKAHDNIKIVATGEGNYDRDQSLKTMQDILQANRDIDVVLSNADQHVFGAQIAIENAGLKIEDLFVMGGGGSTQAIEAVRSGKWDADYANFPVSMGEAALKQVVNSLEGGQVEPVVDADTLGPVPAIVDQKVLDENPDFKGEWTD